MGNIKSMIGRKEFCEFCNIIENSKGMLIYEDEKIVAFHDIDKASAVEHVLVCPKSHINSVNTLTVDDIPLIKNIYSIGESVLNKLRPNCTYRSKNS